MSETSSRTEETGAHLSLRGPFQSQEEAERARARALGLLDEARSALDRGDFHSAGCALRDLEGVADLDLKLRQGLARVWMRCGEPARAARVFETVVRECPGSVQAWRDLVSACVRSGAYARALEAARECVRLAPDDAGDLLNQGACARKAGLEEEGRRCFLAAAVLDPNLFAAFKNLGNSYRDAHEWAEAEKAYRRALEIDPRRSDVWSDLGDVLTRLGRSDASMAAFRQAVHVSPEDPDGWFNFTSACCLNGRLPEARGAYQRLLELDPGWARRVCGHVAGVFRQLSEKGVPGIPQGSPLTAPSFWERTLGGAEPQASR